MNKGVNVVRSLGVSRGVALTNLILMLGLIVLLLVFVTKPVFYMTQSYCGGIYTDEEVLEICIEECHDLERYKEADLGGQIFVLGGIFFVFVALLNAWSCFRRLYKNGMKSPVNKAVGSFVFSFLVMAPFSVLRILLDRAVVAVITDEMDMFNVYDAIYVLGIVVVIVGIVNIFTAFLAKKAMKQCSLLASGVNQ